MASLEIKAKPDLLDLWRTLMTLKSLVKGLALTGMMCCSLWAYAEEQVIFCQEFNKQFEPVNQSDTIEGTQFSFFFKMPQGESLGVNQVVFSLFKSSGNNQEMILRETLETNPRWNAYGFLYADMPELGTYDITFDTVDGKSIAAGRVLLVEPAPDAEPVEKKEQEIVGTTLADIFNKFKQSATTKEK